MTHEGELLAQIEELDSAISRDMDALGRAKSKRASEDLWTRIRLKWPNVVNFETAFPALASLAEPVAPKDTLSERRMAHV